MHPKQQLRELYDREMTKRRMLEIRLDMMIRSMFPEEVDVDWSMKDYLLGSTSTLSYYRNV